MKQKDAILYKNQTQMIMTIKLNKHGVENSTLSSDPLNRSNTKFPLERVLNVNLTKNQSRNSKLDLPSQMNKEDCFLFPKVL